eukprot:4108315-Prymnesium_polylepis.1
MTGKSGVGTHGREIGGRYAGPLTSGVWNEVVDSSFVKIYAFETTSTVHCSLFTVHCSDLKRETHSIQRLRPSFGGRLSRAPPSPAGCSWTLPEPKLAPEQRGGKHDFPVQNHQPGSRKAGLCPGCVWSYPKMATDRYMRRTTALLVPSARPGTG